MGCNASKTTTANVAEPAPAGKTMPSTADMTTKAPAVIAADVQPVEAAVPTATAAVAQPAAAVEQPDGTLAAAVPTAIPTAQLVAGQPDSPVATPVPSAGPVGIAEAEPALPVATPVSGIPTAELVAGQPELPVATSAPSAGPAGIAEAEPALPVATPVSGAEPTTGITEAQPVAAPVNNGKQPLVNGPAELAPGGVLDPVTGMVDNFAAMGGVDVFGHQAANDQRIAAINGQQQRVVDQQLAGIPVEQILANCHLCKRQPDGTFARCHAHFSLPASGLMAPPSAGYVQQVLASCNLCKRQPDGTIARCHAHFNLEGQVAPVGPSIPVEQVLASCNLCKRKPDGTIARCHAHWNLR